MTATRTGFGATVFLGAFLLFLLEPMAAKGLLPILGGSSAVWITCLVFFQTMLLGGYLYAHWLTRSGMRRVHIGLLVAGVAALFLAQHLGAMGDAQHPVATIFRTLGITIGLPFLLLGATSPLLQVWMARIEGTGVRYGLFALSNVGSLLGLLAYPLLIEPHVSLRGQRVGWAVGFAVYAALAAWLASRPGVWQREVVEETVEPRTEGWVRAMWFLLPMGAALQLAAVTSHLTVNIAAIPLLWMLPLAAYLVSFIVAFELPRLYQRGIVVRLLVVMMAGLGYALTKTDSGLPIAISIPFFLVEMFAACLFCHAEVYRLRPSGRHEATAFYLLVAAGGVAGTFYVALVSPLVFSANYDLGISFLVTAALALAVTWKDGWAQRLLWGVGTVLLLALVIGLHVAYGRRVLEIRRNFYGTLRVTENDSPAGPIRMLTNGTIQHGTQIVRQPGLERMPTTYYAWDSGVGLALKGAHRVGVVGLGVGTLAAYGKQGDSIRFYEINPLVRPVAERWFSYIHDSAATISFADGDGRASLHAETPRGFDVLVVDAFSGDAIPLHLLTVEAMREYKRHLGPHGVIAFHVSNQYLNLAPEIAALAKASGMEARLFDTGGDAPKGEYRAEWVLLSGDPAYFERDGMGGATIAAVPGVTAWTDDYSSLLPLVEWGRP
ncbi:hypothetical protein SAMN05421771_0340 [Granulicella pectinivorans]|uniref:Spermidine synthase n=1 Tax=Granulicella pectinivorans TaxID=474950 RepID=A0A1I6L6J1_9BACT|nr:fused MFS/spermidine synthase [Granulicella pectinivorans]SFR99103.1 hypothetical protein SAMN05421771_0340 [Granulicella pectinivorans]